MFHSVIPVFLSSFENQNLCVRTAGLFQGPRLIVDGKLRTPAGKFYVLQDNGGKYVKIRLRRRFLDPIPDIEMGDQTIEITPPFRWYEQLWMSLAGSLMYLHFLLGLVVGLAAYSLNTRIFRSYNAQGLKFLYSGLIMIAAGVVFFSILLGSVAALHALRLSRLEADLNAEGLREIHAVHQPPGRAPDSLGALDRFAYPVQHVDRGSLLALLKSGQYSQLNTRLQALQDEYIRDFRNEQRLAEGYATFGIRDSSLEASLNQWVSRFSRSYIPYLARATYYSARARAAEGEQREIQSDASDEDIREALSFEPRLPVAYRLLIQQARRSGDRPAELLYSSKALQLCGASFLLREEHLRSLLPRWGGSYTAVSAFVRESQELAGVNPKLTLLRGYIDWDMGRSAEANKDLANAIRLYTSALQYGDSPVFLYERGTAYLSDHQFPQAFADLSKALDADPSNPDVLTSLGATCYRLGQSAEALKYLQKALALDASSSWVKEWQGWIGNDLLTRGNERLNAREYDQALEFYNRSLEFNPDNPQVYYYRAASNASLGRMVQAVNDALNAIRMNPRHFESYQLLSGIYAARGDWDAIVDSWTRFIVLEPDNGDAYLERATAYARKGDMEASLRDARKACDLGQSKGCEIARRLSGNP